MVFGIDEKISTYLSIELIQLVFRRLKRIYFEMSNNSMNIWAMIRFIKRTRQFVGVPK